MVEFSDAGLDSTYPHRVENVPLLRRSCSFAGAGVRLYFDL